LASFRVFEAHIQMPCCATTKYKVRQTLLRYRSAVSQDVFSIELKHAQQPVLRASLASLLRFQREVFWNVAEPLAVAGVVHGITV